MKVQGPLMSFGASGTIGGTATFATWKGRPYVRQRVTPANPRSDGQYTTRAMFGFLGQAWGELPVPPGPWQTRADQGKFSPFNAYQRFNMNLWTQALTPLVDPAVENRTPWMHMNAQVLTGGVGQFNYENVAAAGHMYWGIMIMMDSGAIAGFNRSLVTDVFIVDHTDGTINRPVLQVPPGTWHVRALYFDDEGAVGTLTPDDTVVVT